jgi:hypothetical protein
MEPPLEMAKKETVYFIIVEFGNQILWRDISRLLLISSKMYKLFANWNFCTYGIMEIVDFHHKQVGKHV